MARFNLNIDGEALEALESLEKSGISKSEVIRRSLGVYKTLKESAKNKHIVITDDEDNIEKEIIIT